MMDELESQVRKALEAKRREHDKVKFDLSKARKELDRLLDELEDVRKEASALGVSDTDGEVATRQVVGSVSRKPVFVPDQVSAQRPRGRVGPRLTRRDHPQRLKHLEDEWKARQAQVRARVRARACAHAASDPPRPPRVALHRWRRWSTA